MQLDKKVIGHEFKAFTTTVEAGKVKLFCKAIGEEDPIYADEAAAKAAGYSAVPVPPTFLQAITNDDPDKGGLLRLLNVDIGLILHGEQHYEYLAPVHVGDKITCQQEVKDIYDKKFGFKDVFAHGMLSMAFLGRLATSFAPQSQLRKLGTRFTSITWVGDV